MVDRNFQHKEDILFSQSLNLYPAENQAAKIFVEWLRAHPEYTSKEVDMRIDSYEREEDHYGNGGGYDQYVRIYKRREETQDEHNARIKQEEDKYYEEYRNKDGKIFIKSSTQYVPDGLAFFQAAHLVQIAYLHFAGPADLSVIRQQVVGNKVEKSGFTFPVGTYQADVFPFFQFEGNIFQYLAAAEGMAHVSDG